MKYLYHHLSDQPVPGAVDLLAVLAVGDQIKVIGELHMLGDLLQNINTETFTTTLDIDRSDACVITDRQRKSLIYC